MPRKLTQKGFLKRIREIHGDTYDLSRVIYKNTKTKVELICHLHGSWMTRPDQLFRGQGCTICGKKKAGQVHIIAFDDFVKRANKVHKNKYEYFQDDYVKSSSKLRIKCPTHGIFFQRGGEHINSKQGCPNCGYIIGKNKRKLDPDEFINRSNKVHYNFFDYSKIEYKNNSSKVKITCPVHGDFMQEPQNHLNGSSCPKCSMAEQIKRQTKSKKDFIEESISIHGKRYDYSFVEYLRSTKKLKIICKKHGIFSQTPNTHLRGSGCPNCNISRGEELVKRILKKHNISYNQQYSFEGLVDLGKLKCDFYLKDHNVVIEFNGRQHFEPVNAFGGEKGFLGTQKRDELKRLFLSENNIKLLEIHYKEKKVEDMILRFLKL